MKSDAPIRVVGGQPPAQREDASAATASLAQLRRIDSAQLFAGGATELLIDHRGVLYRLKQTSLGKLILTK